jgi:twitching motility protein PilI
MQHFAQDSLESVAVRTLEGAIAPFVKGQFRREQLWQVFSPFALVQSPGFMDVAL